MPDVAAIAAIAARLEREGYRLTAPRKAVVQEILARRTSFTSAELWDSIRGRAPGLGRATLFRTLDLLSRLGVVQRVHRDAEAGRCQAYLACVDAGLHHHHLICNRCGVVADFEEEDKALAALVRDVERRTAFRVEGHRLELLGVCPECIAAGTPAQE